MNGFQWLVAAILTVVGGWLLGTPAGIGVGLAFAAVTVASWTIGRFADPARVRVRRQSDGRLIPVGGTALARVSIAGRGVNPFVWVRVRDRVPENVETEGAVGRFIMGTHAFDEEFFYRARFLRRGAYRFGPLEVASGDLLGLKVRIREEGVSDEILVHPRVIALEGTAVRSLRPFGDRRTDQRATEDPTRPVGARRFESGDTLKRIHWSATARTGRLMSRLYDGASGPLAWIVPSLCKGDWPDEETFELGMTVCASLAVALPEVEGIDAVTTYEGIDEPARQEALLSAIARLQVGEDSLATRLLANQAVIPWRATIIVVTSRLEGDAAAILSDQRRAGHAIAVVAVGADTGETVARAAAIGAEVARIGDEEDIRGLSFVR
ncbi:hypothetical protein BH11ARM2_BH11ARM2_07550 [soil metagenome]